MYRKLSVIVTILILTLSGAMPAQAITGGQPDGNAHPFSALLLIPGAAFCSGTLIAPNVILTAGHCTSLWTQVEDMIDGLIVTFDSQAAVDPLTWLPTGGTWHTAHNWVTFPSYDGAAWPFTRDYGLLFLDQPVAGITPAQLPEAGALAELIGTTGQTDWRFQDVGYGQNGIIVGGGPYFPNYDFMRKASTQRYNPSKGSVGAQDPSWFMLGNVPSDQHGGGCGGDSGSGIFPADGTNAGTTIVAVHTGGNRMGYDDRLCGRMTSLNHRVDLPDVLEWIHTYVD